MSEVKVDPTTFTKHDDEKPRMTLLPPIALFEVAKVLTKGARKYSPGNWINSPVWSRYLDAAQRHLSSFIDGENNDPEWGLSHLAHAICCLMFVLVFQLLGLSKDDRNDMTPYKLPVPPKPPLPPGVNPPAPHPPAPPLPANLDPANSGSGLRAPVVSVVAAPTMPMGHGFSAVLRDPPIVAGHPMPSTPEPSAPADPTGQSRTPASPK